MILGPATSLARVPQDALDYVAAKGTYVLDINPREILINGIGIDGFVGGGNFWVGCSAADLDDVLVWLSTWPKATIALDVGTFSDSWLSLTVADVIDLRAAFFARYGTGKPDWYGPVRMQPLPYIWFASIEETVEASDTVTIPRALLAEDRRRILLDGREEGTYLAVDVPEP